MAGDPHFLKDIWKLLLSSINGHKIRKFCVWEVMIAIVFKQSLGGVLNTLLLRYHQRKKNHTRLSQGASVVLVQIRVNFFIYHVEIPLTVEIVVFSCPEPNLQASIEDRQNQLMVSYCNYQKWYRGIKARVYETTCNQSFTSVT